MRQDRRKFSREAYIEKTTGEIYVGFWEDQRKNMVIQIIDTQRYNWEDNRLLLLSF